MSWKLRRPSKPTVFAILMVGTALLALLPLPWTGCAGGLAQPLAWLTWLLSAGTRQAHETVDAMGSAVPTRATLEDLRAQNEELARQVAHQQMLLAELERELANVSGLRDQLGDLEAKIIFAAVVGGDTSPRRETLTISKGRRHGVKRGDWVAAGDPPTQRDRGATGRDLLLRQWLIGRISEVQPYLSRVELATDTGFGPARVWTAKGLQDGRWEVADRHCALRGVGEGRMLIDRALQDFWASGHTVVLAPVAYPRPMALALGRITSSRILETGLHYDLEVKPWADPYRLSHVYVISAGR